MRQLSLHTFVMRQAYCPHGKPKRPVCDHCIKLPWKWTAYITEGISKRVWSLEGRTDSAAKAVKAVTHALLDIPAHLMAKL